MPHQTTINQEIIRGYIYEIDNLACRCLPCKEYERSKLTHAEQASRRRSRRRDRHFGLSKEQEWGFSAHS
jgi:hypothetical protein